MNRDHLGRFSKNKPNGKDKRINNIRNHCYDNFDTTCLSTNAAGSNLSDHTYFSAEQNSSDFDDFNDLFFAGRLQHLSHSRFIVNIESLRSNMKCHNCNKQVSLEDVLGVLPLGVCGHLIARCKFCSSVVKIAMGKTHTGQHGKGPKIFDVNTKLATAMYHIGIGPEQLNNFLTTMNLPAVATKTIKRRCAEVGCTLEQLAEESTDKALQKEVELTYAESLLSSITCNRETESVQNESTVGDYNVVQNNGGVQDVLENSCHEPIIEPGYSAVTYDDLMEDGTFGNIYPIENSIEPAAGEFPSNATLPLTEETIHRNNIQSSIVDTQSEFNEITASADGTYQRRGSGRCYNSLSGAASLIGKKTGKVLSYTARYKKCRICSVAESKKKQPRKHTCRKNWKGSAKSMEPDMVVELLQNTKKKKAVVKTLIGDDDCTAFNRARREVHQTMEKLSDKNHVKKNLSSQLYKLKPKYKELSVKTINAIMKGFSYMLAQAKGNHAYIKDGLHAVVLHQFGNHSHCASWCKMSDESDSSRLRKHKNLPWGSDLTDINLKKALLTIFLKLDADKLAKMDTSNANESFNNTLRSKAPKDKHYSDSESLAHRLSAAVCQKNDGYGYVTQVHTKLGLSPGQTAIKRASMLNKNVSRKKEKSRTRQFKLRRILLKSERSSQTRSSEIREGDTYLSNVLDCEREPDLETIPAPIANNLDSDTPALVQENQAQSAAFEEHDYDKEATISVFYDLETTGLGRDSSLTQLSARCKDVTFDKYITPTKEISPEASNVTGLYFDEMSNTMFHNKLPVSHVHPMNALLDFITFLTTFGKKIILIAHNNKKFDCIILHYQLKCYNLWNHFCKFVIGFADTLPFFRKLYPDFVNHKQETLVSIILKESYVAHNAAEDCLYLQKLVFKSEQIDMLLSEFMFSSKQVTKSGVQPQVMSVEYLQQTKVLSNHIALKLKKSSLTYHHLQLAYERDGYDGLYFLLSEKDLSGNPRITKSRNVVQRLSDHFKRLSI